MANAFTHIRKRVLGLTQKEFAESLGVAQSTVSRWEADELHPSSDEMAKMRQLAVGRGVDWDDRWFFEAPPKPEPAATSEAA